MNEPTAPSRLAGDGRWQRPAAVALTLGGLILAIVLGAISDGFHQDDDALHYLYARDGWSDAHKLWHGWSRPGYSLPTMLVARWFGLFGCRAFSAVQTAATALLAYGVARRLGEGDGRGRRWALAAPVLVWAQPMAMTLACTTLTETPAMLYLTLALWLYVRGNRVWASAVLSLLAVTRYETVALWPIVAAAVLLDAREAGGSLAKALRQSWAWGCAAALLWAPVAYFAVTKLVALPDELSPFAHAHGQHTGQYGFGTWGHYLPVWVDVAGAGVLALAAAGTLAAGRRGWLVWAMPAGLVALHTVLYRFGWFGASGYARFLVPTAGPVAAVGAVGLGRLASRPRWPAVIAATAVLLSAARVGIWAHLAWWHTPVLALLLVVLYVRSWRTRHGAGLAAVALLVLTAPFVLLEPATTVGPLKLTDDDLHAVLAECVEQADAAGLADRPALSMHSVPALLHGPTEVVFTEARARQLWDEMPPGGLFFWDGKYGPKLTTAPAPNTGLHGDLLRLGRRIARRQRGQAVAELFVRR